MMQARNEAIDQINELGAAAVPFFFFTDFEGKQAWVKPLHEIRAEELQFDFGGAHPTTASAPSFSFNKQPVGFSTFKGAFDRIIHEIRIGNSFLVNLTFKTPIDTSLSLQEIFRISKAKYRLRYKDEFVVFSPETFVQIRDGRIYSYPMKGTIDAATPDAEKIILEDTKETAEHVTIVDLIRNDLSQIATNIEVTNFRFFTEINTHEKKLLQVSSEIRGELPHNYAAQLGTLLFRLLPAGSICGAPKPKTVEIIKRAENHSRGFYTGICGCFDGKNLDSGVMIRYIEQEGGQLYYKSGGGITSFSVAEKEYQELMDKIYVPLY